MFNTIVNEVMDKLVPKINKEYFEDDMKFQVVGAYLFGMINGLGSEMDMNPEDIKSEMINLLMNRFYYNETYSEDFTQHLINSTDKEYHPTVHAIIHRGMKGYFLMKEEHVDLVIKDLDSIIKVVENA